MGKICKELKPTACLECIAGEMTGIMMEFLHNGGTMILYGSLEQKPLSGVPVGILMNNNLKLEGYMLMN